MAKNKTTSMTTPYFWGPKSDFFFLGGGSLLLFPVLFYYSHRPELALILSSVFLLQFIINYPHFSATLYRLYRSQKSILSFPVTSFVIPFVVFVITIAAIFSTGLFAPVFFMVYTLWSAYHFCGQSGGVTMIYARRNNYFIGKRERFFLSGFIFSSALLSLMWVADKKRYTSVFDLGFIPELEQLFQNTADLLAVPPVIEYTVAGFLVYAAFMYYTLIFKQARGKKEKHPPLMLMIIPVVHFFWFALATRLGVFGFVALVPLFHSLQYLYIAWTVQLREVHSDRNIKPDISSTLKESIKWYGWNILGGVILFMVLPAVFAHFAHIDFWLSYILVGSGVQIHHFFVDGVIWKLRDQNALSALTTNIPDWIKTKGRTA